MNDNFKEYWIDDVTIWDITYPCETVVNITKSRVIAKQFSLSKQPYRLPVRMIIICFVVIMLVYIFSLQG